MTRTINSQDGIHQYSNGVPITKWDIKKGAWIVLKEFENDTIDWFGQDSDYPAGYTEKEYSDLYPNWNVLPNITVQWTWNTKQQMISAFKSRGSELEWYNNQEFPYSDTRSWGNLDYDKEKAIQQLGKYCDFYKYASLTKVFYNQEIIFEGELK